MQGDAWFQLRQRLKSHAFANSLLGVDASKLRGYVVPEGALGDIAQLHALPDTRGLRALHVRDVVLGITQLAVCVDTSILPLSAVPATAALPRQLSATNPFADDSLPSPVPAARSANPFASASSPPSAAPSASPFKITIPEPLPVARVTTVPTSAAAPVHAPSAPVWQKWCATPQSVAPVPTPQPSVPDDEARRRREVHIQRLQSITHNMLKSPAPWAASRAPSLPSIPTPSPAPAPPSRRATVSAAPKPVVAPAALKYDRLPLEPADWRSLAPLFASISQSAPVFLQLIELIGRINRRFLQGQQQLRARSQEPEFMTRPLRVFVFGKRSSNVTVPDHVDGRTVDRAPLLEKCDAMLGASARLVLTGPVGVGKTHTALLLALRTHPSQLTWVFDATTAESVARDYARLAQHLGIDTNGLHYPELVFKVNVRLQDGARIAHWLLLFDNAPSESALTAMVPGGLPAPRSRTGLVVITSRSAAWTQLADSVVHVGSYCGHEAEAHLASMLPDCNTDDCQRLLQRLQGHPLSVDLAARHLACDRRRVSEYIALLDKQCLRTQQPGLHAVLSLSLEFIDRNSTLARVIIMQLAVLPVVCVPQTAIERLAAFLQQGDRLADALMHLRQLGLVAVTTGEGNNCTYYTLPRALAEVLEAHVTPHDRLSCLCAWTAIFIPIFNPLQSLTGALHQLRDDTIAHAKHVMAQLLRVEQDRLACVDERSLLDVPVLLLCAGSHCYATSQLSTAVWFISRAVHAVGDLLGHSHPQLLATLSNTISVYAARLDYRPAAALSVVLADMYTAKFGPHHPDIAATHFRTASYQLSSGEHAGAIVSFHAALETLLALDPHDARAVMLRHNIGVLHGLLDDTAHALAFLRECLAYFEQSARLFDVGCTHNTIGCIYARARQLPQAIQCFERALATFQVLYPSNQHDVLDTTLRYLVLACTAHGLVIRADSYRAERQRVTRGGSERSNCYLPDSMLLAPLTAELAAPVTLRPRQISAPAAPSLLVSTAPAGRATSLLAAAAEAFHRMQWLSALDLFKQALLLEMGVVTKLTILERMGAIHIQLSSFDAAAQALSMAVHLGGQGTGSAAVTGRLLLQLSHVHRLRRDFAAAIDTCERSVDMHRALLGGDNDLTKAAVAALDQLFHDVAASPSTQATAESKVEPPTSASGTNVATCPARDDRRSSESDDYATAGATAMPNAGEAIPLSSAALQHTARDVADIAGAALNAGAAEPVGDSASLASGSDTSSDYARADWLNFPQLGASAVAAPDGACSPETAVASGNGRSFDDDDESLYSGRSIRDYEHLASNSFQQVVDGTNTASTPRVPVSETKF